MHDAETSDCQARLCQQPVLYTTCWLTGTLPECDNQQTEDPETHTVLPGEWRQQDQENLLPGIQRQPRNTATADWNKVRDYLTEFFNGVGAVPWQNGILGLQDSDSGLNVQKVPNIIGSDEDVYLMMSVSKIILCDAEK